MKILFCSNYFSHHQKPVSDALVRLTDGDYTFLAHQKMEDERIRLGWQERDVPDYVRSASDPCAELLRPDVLIAGAFPPEWLEPFAREAQLVLRYAERPLKQGDTAWK